MKKQIRNKVFETNSSSTHSISIATNSKEFMMDTSLLPDQYGVVELTGGQFGWDWQKYNDALTKANYCAVHAGNNMQDLNILIEVLKKQTGAKNIAIGIGDSYIDHQSGGTAGKAFKNYKTLRNFIFNKNSWLFTGNDNSTADPMFYDVPKFKGRKVIKPIYKYELKVNGYDKTTKFKKKPSKKEITNGLYALLESVHLHEDGYFDDDNSIGMQLIRDRSKVYEFGFCYLREPINYKNKTVTFRREAWEDARQIHKNKFPNVDWQGEDGYKKCRDIENELYEEPNSPYIKKIKFSIKTIK